MHPSTSTSRFLEGTEFESLISIIDGATIFMKLKYRNLNPETTGWKFKVPNHYNQVMMIGNLISEYKVNIFCKKLAAKICPLPRS